jgi:hypothetical protein
MITTNYIKDGKFVKQMINSDDKLIGVIIYFTENNMVGNAYVDKELQGRGIYTNALLEYTRKTGMIRSFNRNESSSKAWEKLKQTLPSDMILIEVKNRYGTEYTLKLK